MVDDSLLYLLRSMLLVAMMLILPPLGVALLTGLAIGLLQAITSIQEQTLTFVPKLVAVATVFVVAGAWMLRVLVSYSSDLFASLPSWGAL